MELAGLTEYGVLGILVAALLGFALKVYSRMAAKIDRNDKWQVSLIASHEDRMEELIRETQDCIRNNTEAFQGLRQDMMAFAERIRRVEEGIDEVRSSIEKVADPRRMP